MGPKTETYTFSQIKELLQMHEKTLLIALFDVLNEENSKIKKEFTDLRESVQYHSDNVDEVNKKAKEH